MKNGVKSLNFKSKTPTGFIKSVPKMDDLLFNPSVFIDQKKEKLQPCLYADFGMPSAKKIVGGFRDRIGRVPHPNEDTCWSYGKVEDAT